MAKDIKQIPEQEQDPQAGGSYIRNEDGSLVKNEADPQKTTPAETPVAQTSKD